MEPRRIYVPGQQWENLRAAIPQVDEALRNETMVDGLKLDERGRVWLKVLSLRGPANFRWYVSYQTRDCLGDVCPWATINFDVEEWGILTENAPKIDRALLGRKRSQARRSGFMPNPSDVTTVFNFEIVTADGHKVYCDREKYFQSHHAQNMGEKWLLEAVVDCGGRGQQFEAFQDATVMVASSKMTVPKSQRVVEMCYYYFIAKNLERANVRPREIVDLPHRAGKEIDLIQVAKLVDTVYSEMGLNKISSLVMVSDFNEWALGSAEAITECLEDLEKCSETMAPLYLLVHEMYEVVQDLVKHKKKVGGQK